MNAIRKIDIWFAAGAVIALSACALVFQALILAGAIPYSVVWGGRLESEAQMYRFESVSIAINLFIIFVVAMRGGIISGYLPERLITVVLWMLVVLFSANTLGNLFAETAVEKMVFTPLTLAAALMCYRLAMKEETGSASSHPQTGMDNQE